MKMGWRASESVLLCRVFGITGYLLSKDLPTPSEVILTMVKYPEQYDVRFTRSRTYNILKMDFARAYNEAKKLEASIGRPINKLTYEDVHRLDLPEDLRLVILEYLLVRNGLNRLVIYAGSNEGILPTTPVRLFGYSQGLYNHRRAFSIPINDFITHVYNFYDVLSSLYNALRSK
jgi:hypothetical protein